MAELETQTIPVEMAGQRLDKILAELWPDYSRSRLTAWLKSGRIKVNGGTLKPKEKMMGGEVVTIDPEQDVVVENQAEAIDLDVVFEDEHILVINKPAGLVVHPGAGNWTGTLLNALLHYCPSLETVPRAGIVHRLDKLTTGLMVVAKTVQAQNHLVEQLQARTVSRQYEAVVKGKLISGGMVDERIGRHPTDRKKMGIVQSGGKEAITHYRVTERFRAHTHVTCYLETGRTHQIRVHMAHIRHSLVGDPQYGQRFNRIRGMDDDTTEVLRHFNRQALHASALALIHPVSEEEMIWRVDLPEDMQTLIDTLRADAEHAEND